MVKTGLRYSLHAEKVAGAKTPMVKLMNLITTLGFHTEPCLMSKMSGHVVKGLFYNLWNEKKLEILYDLALSNSDSMCGGTSKIATNQIQLGFTKIVLQRPNGVVYAKAKNLGSPKVNKFNHGDRKFVVGLMLSKDKSLYFFSHRVLGQKRLSRTVTEPMYQPNYNSTKSYRRLFGTSSKPRHPKEFSEILENGSPFIKSKDGDSKVKFSALNTSKLIHVIGHPAVLLLAYEQIKSKTGNMTFGLDAETLDGISFETILRYSDQLKAGTFKFNLARRIIIPKPGKTSKRALTIASPRVKIVQKAMQLVLTELYEPKFSEHSHGFRPNRSCLSALKQINLNFRSKKWIIEADLEKCFDSIAHDKLLDILGRTIKCNKTLALIKSALKAGYSLEGNIIKDELVGTPQENVLSPLLCNIFLNEFDRFVESEIIHKYEISEKRRTNPIYKKAVAMKKLYKNFPKDGFHRKSLSKVQKIVHKSFIKNVKSVINERWELRSKDLMNPNYIKIGYTRYADNFVIGLASSIALAFEILSKIRSFLKTELALNLSDEKTKVSDFEKGIKFLGAIIKLRIPKEKPIVIIKTGKRKKQKTAIAPRLSFHAPIESLLKRMITRGLFKWTHSVSIKDRIRPTALRSMANLDHVIIVQYYNSIIHGLLSYYRFADNRKSMGSIVHGLKMSCAHTLALKYKLRTVAKVFKKYGSLLKAPSDDLKRVTQIYLPGNFKRLNYVNKFDTRMAATVTPENIINRSYANKLTHSMLGMPCIICGTTDNIQAHHLKK